MVPPFGRSYLLNTSTWSFYFDHRNSYGFQSAWSLRREALMNIIWLLAHLIALSKRARVMVLGVWRIRWRTAWARAIWRRVWVFIIHWAVAVTRWILNRVQREHVSLDIPLTGKRDLLKVDKWMNHPYSVSLNYIVNSRADFKLWRLGSLHRILVIRRYSQIIMLTNTVKSIPWSWRVDSTRRPKSRPLVANAILVLLYRMMS